MFIEFISPVIGDLIIVFSKLDCADNKPALACSTLASEIITSCPLTPKSREELRLLYELIREDKEFDNELLADETSPLYLLMSLWVTSPPVVALLRAKANSSKKFCIEDILSCETRMIFCKSVVLF